MNGYRIRILPWALFGLLVFLQYRLWGEPQGIIQAYRLKKQLAAELIVNQRLKQRNMVLRSEVTHLQRGGDAIESRAREDLGMIRKGETFFHENITQ